jgi:hypothetical protein
MTAYVECNYPLPVPELQKACIKTYSFNDADTDSNGYTYADNFEIREDGTLWRNYYDVEDNTFKLKQVMMTGEVILEAYNYRPALYAEFSVYFVRGELKFFVQIHAHDVFTKRFS